MRTPVSSPPGSGIAFVGGCGQQGGGEAWGSPRPWGPASRSVLLAVNLRYPATHLEAEGWAAAGWVEGRVEAMGWVEVVATPAESLQAGQG